MVNVFYMRVVTLKVSNDNYCSGDYVRDLYKTTRLTKKKKNICKKYYHDLCYFEKCLK